MGRVHGGRGVMKYYENGRAFAKDIGVDVQVLVDEHQRHFEAGKKMEKDPEGGPFPAYPSGKCWDEPSGKTGSQKKWQGIAWSICRRRGGGRRSWKQSPWR